MDEVTEISVSSSLFLNYEGILMAKYEFVRAKIDEMCKACGVNHSAKTYANQKELRKPPDELNHQAV